MESLDHRELQSVQGNAKKESGSENLLEVFGRSFRERETHKHKQICGIVLRLGGLQNWFTCFFCHSCGKKS